MASILVYELCDTNFWDNNVTWYTNQPEFTPCFRDTALIWIPATFILLVLAIERLNIQQVKSRGSLITIPWNIYNRFRLLVTILLLAVKLIEFSSYVYELLDSTSNQFDIIDETNFINQYDGYRKLVISSFIAPIIQSISYVILAAIYYKHRKAGLHTSAAVWFYLLISLLCNLIDFYSVISSVQPAIYNSVELLVKYSHLFLIITLFILECRGDTPKFKLDLTSERADPPLLQASFFSRFTFWWFNGFLVAGSKNQLRIDDMWKLMPENRTNHIANSFRTLWYHIRQNSYINKSGQMYQLANGEFQPFNRTWFVLVKLIWPNFLFVWSLRAICDVLQFTNPLLLKRLLRFMQSPDEPQWHGLLLAFLLLLMPTIQSIITGNCYYLIQVYGQRMKTAIIGSVYRKSLLLSGSSRLQSTSGEMVNLMAVDPQNFLNTILQLINVINTPIQIAFCLYLLYRELGWSIFVGFACTLMTMPLNAIIARLQERRQRKLMKTKDNRAKQTNELLNGIKVIKLYAWEHSFSLNLSNLRLKELNYLLSIQNLGSLLQFFWLCNPVLVTLITFAVYVNENENNLLDAEKAFVSISLFNMLKLPLQALPVCLSCLITTFVSSVRLSKFFNNDELVAYVTRNDEQEAIAIEGGTLAWSKEDKSAEKDSSIRAVLKDINFHVKPKSFVAIVGQVASGKSSLIASILGEMHRIAGRFNVCKSMSLAYVPQQAWIQNMTLKDNLLFGSQFNEDYYKQVLSACALEQDLAILPGGDQVEIGEKGINLSGGQKQRVSLARACYSNSDIYLLDDPLSALDSHVAKHVFDKVLSSDTGLLRDKTRVLATNSLFVLPHVDYIVVMKEGRIVESGTYKDLMKIEGGHLSECMGQYSSSADKKKTADEEEKENPVIDSIKDKLIIKPTSVDASKSLAQAGKLTEIEKMETGRVDIRVYLDYFKAVSPLWMICIVTFFIGATCFNMGMNIWLSIWSNDSKDPNKMQDSSLRTTRLIVYASLGCSQCLLVLVGGLSLSSGAVRASKHLYNNLSERILHSPMSFFDTTPMGRVINRFSKDIDVVDSMLPGNFRSWIPYCLNLVSTILIICYSFPAFTLATLPLSLAFYIIQKLIVTTTRQLKRLEAVTSSPIYSHFTETLNGLSSIRAYNCVDRFVEHSDKLVDTNQSCSYPWFAANRWLSIRLEFLANLLISSVAFYAVYYRGQIDSALVGLSISFSVTLCFQLSWLVRYNTELETNIVSVERIFEYMNNEQEDSWIKSNRPSEKWPVEGNIQIQDYSTRYREDTDLVLKDISIDIKPSEKVGIVGRTGSGKSSLSLSLFRILEPASGRIVIDGLNLADFGLHDIRSKLTIIPQDPVLFSGTLRFNLDPLKLYSDLDIWRALELAHLKSYINTLSTGLDYKVSEYGENFSVGQRQLICLARAILRKSKILILDEATASVDLETDSIVQKTIREIFSDCTIITIAHRLHTILDSDRILVLDKGRVKELDSPIRLISDSNSEFSSLVRDAGIEKSSILKLTAPPE